MSKPKKRMTGRGFDALPDAEKERIFGELGTLAPEQVAKMPRLTPAQEQKLYRSPRKKKGGRPMLGKTGTTNISVSVEKSLLKEANEFARSKGLKRSELVSAGLRMMLANPGKAHVRRGSPGALPTSRES